MWLGRPHKTDVVRRSPLKPLGDGNVLEGVGRGTHVWYRGSADQWVPATLLSDPGPTCKIALGLDDHNLQGQVRGHSGLCFLSAKAMSCGKGIAVRARVVRLLTEIEKRRLDKGYCQREQGIWIQ
jgi:hypothetical protein